jgi:hypothetical protein
VIKRPLCIDFSRTTQDLKTVAALAEQQTYDLRQAASTDRPEFAMLTQLHRFYLSIDNCEVTRLEFRSSSKQLAFTLDGNGACRRLSAFVDVAGYLALYYRTPDWQARLLTRYTLMAIKVVASKLGTLGNHTWVNRELARIAECDDQLAILASVLTIAPPVLLRGLGGATDDVIDAHAAQLGMPLPLLRNLIEFSQIHRTALGSPQLPDGWHQARFRYRGSTSDPDMPPTQTPLLDERFAGADTQAK